MAIRPMFMEQADEFGEGPLGWVDRVEGVSGEDAIRLAVRELRLDPDTLQARAVLMRLQSEVEARIEPVGPDGEPCYVECTSRARHPEPYWRIEFADPPRRPPVRRALRLGADRGDRQATRRARAEPVPAAPGGSTHSYHGRRAR